MHIGLFQKKKQGEGGGHRRRGVADESILFLTPLLSGIFHFFTLPLEILEKTKLHPWKFHKILLDPLEVLRPKPKTSGNSTLHYFLVTLGNSTLFKFHLLFL